jgi:hypothetical protein
MIGNSISNSIRSGGQGGSGAETISVVVIAGATGSNCEISIRDTGTFTTYSVQLTNGEGVMPPEAPVDTTYSFLGLLQSCVDGTPSFENPQTAGDTLFEIRID